MSTGIQIEAQRPIELVPQTREGDERPLARLTQYPNIRRRRASVSDRWDPRLLTVAGVLGVAVSAGVAYEAYDYFASRPVAPVVVTISREPTVAGFQAASGQPDSGEYVNEVTKATSVNNDKLTNQLRETISLRTGQEVTDTWEEVPVSGFQAYVKVSEGILLREAASQDAWLVENKLANGQQDPKQPYQVLKYSLDNKPIGYFQRVYLQLDQEGKIKGIWANYKGKGYFAIYGKGHWLTGMVQFKEQGSEEAMTETEEVSPLEMVLEIQGMRRLLTGRQSLVFASDKPQAPSASRVTGF